MRAVVEYFGNGDVEENSLRAHALNGAHTNARKAEWKSPKDRDSLPPHALTVTKIKQAHDLQDFMDAIYVASKPLELNNNSKDLEAAFAGLQGTSEWLQSHGLKALALSMDDLIVMGDSEKTEKDKITGESKQFLQFNSTQIVEFEYKVNLAIELYTKRIKWLLQGSRRTFGVLKGSNVAVLIDSSDANLGFGRLTALQESLMHFIDEQFSTKRKIYLLDFGTEVTTCWPFMRDVNERILNETKEYVTTQLRPSGGCNLLRAIQHVNKLKDVNAVCLILGSLPDQPSEVLASYVEQLNVGANRPLHTVAYDTNNIFANEVRRRFTAIETVLRQLSETSGGRYHCYSATTEERIYTSTDIRLLLSEIRSAQEVLDKVKSMREGLLENALISIENEITKEIASLPPSRYLPRPPGHELPLRLQPVKFHATSSAAWLKENGLRPKKLDLYQILFPNTYTYKEDFVPVVNKVVASTVNERAMVQFEWSDGSTRNVHVEVYNLMRYQKKLGEAVQLYEKRIDWLSSSSRRIFGTIYEKRVVMLIDLSATNANYLIHIQHSLRLLMEQQLCEKEYFNIIIFGAETRAFRPTLVRPTEKTLQEAWRWILQWRCAGSRDFMSAFRLAVENDSEIQHNIYADGMYLFTSGVPNQTTDPMLSFIESSCCAVKRKLHVVLFNVELTGTTVLPGRYADMTRTADTLRAMTHCTGGRFHWFRETGIVESDDISMLRLEIEKAIDFSRKCTELIEAVKRKYAKPVEPQPTQEPIPALPEPPKLKALPPPKDTAASLARKILSGTVGKSGVNVVSKSLSQLDLNGANSGSDGKEASTNNKASNGSVTPKKSKRRRRSMGNNLKTSSFYLDDPDPGYDIGSVIEKFPEKRSVRKEIPRPAIPDAEEQTTSKQWLRLYGINRLKLDLTKLVSGPDCRHVDKPVKALKKRVSAKYCEIFPSINVNGTIKHLQLLPNELDMYRETLEYVLRRYVRRLQWLLSGSRRVFGAVVEKRIVLLIDCSGSMQPHMNSLKQDIASLIWEQFFTFNIRFNLIAFSGTCNVWKPDLMEPTEAACHEAVSWISQLEAVGNTCTLEALQKAFDHDNVQAVYLLSDGKPDTTTSAVLRETARINQDRGVVINSISFNCEDSTANTFLRLLAAETGGRYHRCHGSFDVDVLAHNLLSGGFSEQQAMNLPEFEGDDLRRLAAEIAQARCYLQQATYYRALSDEKQASSRESSKVANSESDSKAENKPTTSARRSKSDGFVVGPGKRVNAPVVRPQTAIGTRPRSARPRSDRVMHPLHIVDVSVP